MRKFYKLILTMTALKSKMQAKWTVKHGRSTVSFLQTTGSDGTALVILSQHSYSSSKLTSSLGNTRAVAAVSETEPS